jgi:uncharacterized protein (DUF2132 family)
MKDMTRRQYVAAVARFKRAVAANFNLRYSHTASAEQKAAAQKEYEAALAAIQDVELSNGKLAHKAADDCDDRTCICQRRA